MVRLLVLSLLSLAFLGCTHQGMSALIHSNQLNLQKLKIGMTKAEAVETMGTQSAETTRGVYANPVRTETFTDKAGMPIEVLHYIAHVSRGYRETTPLVFKNGTLIGWGPEALRQAR